MASVNGTKQDTQDTQVNLIQGHEVSIYVPTTWDKDKLLPELVHNFVVRRCELELSALFGGCTTTKGTGSYVDSCGDLIREDVTIVSSISTGLTSEELAAVKLLALNVKSLLLQESVLVTISLVASDFIS